MYNKCLEWHDISYVLPPEKAQFNLMAIFTLTTLVIIEVLYKCMYHHLIQHYTILSDFGRWPVGLKNPGLRVGWYGTPYPRPVMLMCRVG